MNVPLTEVQKRDPKGLYKKVGCACLGPRSRARASRDLRRGRRGRRAQVAAGELKGFTGVDAPYEAPEKPDIDLPNWDMSIDECVATLIASLKKEGVREPEKLLSKALLILITRSRFLQFGMWEEPLFVPLLDISKLMVIIVNLGNPLRCPLLRSKAPKKWQQQLLKT